jgi:glutathione reductase (NADPH)
MLLAMPEFDVDLFVIGGGSGGVRAARVAAGHGARVAIAENSRWGGTCVIRGCVPKKLMVYASEVSRMISDARGQGWTIPTATFDWPTFLLAKDKEIARLETIYVELLQSKGVRVISGRATLADAHVVEVGGERISAKHILIATGSKPRVPSSGTWITSDEAFQLQELPRRVAILGAGYIGIEFAHIFRGFGSEVTLVHRGELLRGFDPDLVAEVTNGLERAGIAISNSGSVADIPHDVAMAAIGRAPMSSGIGLEQLGVKLGPAGSIDVDEWSRSSVPHIYAVGDVTCRVPLTPIAIREGQAFADTVFGNMPTPMLYHAIPTAVFAQPPAAACGFTEPGATHAGHDVVCYRAKFRPMRYALSGREEYVLVKLVVDRHSTRVLGVHMVGPDTPEIVQAAAIAITMNATKGDFDRTFALHPTTAEELVLLR